LTRFLATSNFLQWETLRRRKKKEKEKEKGKKKKKN